jgi:PKD repeat protein
VAKLTVTAKDGRSSVSYATVPSRAPSDVAPLSVAIEAVPLQSPAGIAINFYSTVGGGKGPYAYRWDLGDGTVSNGSDPVYAYGQSGIYPVTLVVTDSLGQRAAAKLVVAVSENPDIDGDGVPNGDDSCPTVYGPKSNKGCPVVPEYSSTSGKGPFRNGAALTIDSVGSKCLLSTAAGSGAIFATALACTTCPCSCDLDFVSQIRRCDILFPTILSPDKKTIYGRGPVYEVQ